MKREEVIRELFKKYLAGDCTPGEKATIMAYFHSENNEEHVRELIREEFSKDIPVDVHTVKTVEEVYATFDWVQHPRNRRHPSIRLPFKLNSRVAAAWVGIVLSLAAVSYFYRLKKNTPEKSLTAATATGERKKVTLNDGTVVWLNAASRLTYPERFSGDRREVVLEGEGFFDVTRNPEKPFVIRSGALKTTVLGTSFNIRAYREDKTMSVAVVTGKVKVASSETELYLTPDELAVFDKKQQRLDKKAESAASEVVGWKEGVLRFRNTTFSEVTAVLQRSRGVGISYEPRLENCPVIHADFDAGDSLERILNTLMVAVNGRVEKNPDGTYFLRSDMDCHL